MKIVKDLVIRYNKGNSTSVKLKWLKVFISVLFALMHFIDMTVKEGIFALENTAIDKYTKMV